MAVVHTYFNIVVDTQRGCRTLKKPQKQCSQLAHTNKTLQATDCKLVRPHRQEPFGVDSHVARFSEIRLLFVIRNKQETERAPSVRCVH